MSTSIAGRTGASLRVSLRLAPRLSAWLVACGRVLLTLVVLVGLGVATGEVVGRAAASVVLRVVHAVPTGPGGGSGH